MFIFIKVTFNIFLISFSSISFGNENYKNLLKQDLDNYAKCYSNQDYRCVSSYILPSVIQKIGGINGFIKTMKSFS